MPLFGQNRKHTVIDWRQPTHPNCSSFDERQQGKATTGPFQEKTQLQAIVMIQKKKKKLSKDTKLVLKNLKLFIGLISNRREFLKNTIKLQSLGKSTHGPVGPGKVGFRGLKLVISALLLNRLV